jgi:hypothetical protein
VAGFRSVTIVWTLTLSEACLMVCPDLVFVLAKGLRELALYHSLREGMTKTVWAPFFAQCVKKRLSKPTGYLSGQSSVPFASPGIIIAFCLMPQYRWIASASACLKFDRLLISG